MTEITVGKVNKNSSLRFILPRSLVQLRLLASAELTILISYQFFGCLK